jgi:hypothetical protein
LLRLEQPRGALVSSVFTFLLLGVAFIALRVEPKITGVSREVVIGSS